MDRLVDNIPRCIRARIFPHSKIFFMFIIVIVCSCSCSRLFFFLPFMFFRNPHIYNTFDPSFPLLFDVICHITPSVPALHIIASSYYFFLCHLRGSPTPRNFSGGSSLGVPVVSPLYPHSSITAFDVYYCLIVFKCYSYHFLVAHHHIW